MFSDDQFDRTSKSADKSPQLSSPQGFPPPSRNALFSYFIGIFHFLLFYSDSVPLSVYIDKEGDLLSCWIKYR